jgi:hypothetical protein
VLQPQNECFGQEIENPNDLFIGHVVDLPDDEIEGVVDGSHQPGTSLHLIGSHPLPEQAFLKAFHQNVHLPVVDLFTDRHRLFGLEQGP